MNCDPSRILLKRIKKGGKYLIHRPSYKISD
nr:MAG TPA: hypothetical protein [Caudoviricetes sp.]